MRFIRFAMFSLFWAIIVAAFGTMGIQILLGLQDKLSGMPFLFLVDFSYIIVALGSSAFTLGLYIFLFANQDGGEE